MTFPSDRSLRHSQLQLMKRVLNPTRPERNFAPWILCASMMLGGIALIYFLSQII